jgi:hypothetical protein
MTGRKSLGDMRGKQDPTKAFELLLDAASPRLAETVRRTTTGTPTQSRCETPAKCTCGKRDPLEAPKRSMPDAPMGAADVVRIMTGGENLLLRRFEEACDEYGHALQSVRWALTRLNSSALVLGEALSQYAESLLS